MLIEDNVLVKSPGPGVCVDVYKGEGGGLKV